MLARSTSRHAHHACASHHVATVLKGRDSLDSCSFDDSGNPAPRDVGLKQKPTRRMRLPILPCGGAVHVFWDIDNISCSSRWSDVYSSDAQASIFLRVSLTAYSPQVRLRVWGNPSTFGRERKAPKASKGKKKKKFRQAPRYSFEWDQQQQQRGEGERNYQDLRELGYKPVIVSRSSQAADEAIIEAIDTVLEQAGPAGLICIVSNDKDFRPSLRKAKSLGWSSLAIVTDGCKLANAADAALEWKMVAEGKYSAKQKQPRASDPTSSGLKFWRPESLVTRWEVGSLDLGSWLVDDLKKVFWIHKGKGRKGPWVTGLKKDLIGRVEGLIRNNLKII